MQASEGRVAVTRESGNEKVNEAVGTLTEPARETFRAIMEETVAVQQQNMDFAVNVLESGLEEFGKVAGRSAYPEEENARFVRSFFERSVEMYDLQTEIGRNMLQTWMEQAERQQKAFQTLMQQSVDAYMELVFYPFSGYRKAAKVGGGTRSSGESSDGQNLPIENYDRLNAEEITGRLGGLDASEVERLKAYERRNKNRKVLLEHFDRSMV